MAKKDPVVFTGEPTEEQLARQAKIEPFQSLGFDNELIGKILDAGIDTPEELATLTKEQLIGTLDIDEVQANQIIEALARADIDAGIVLEKAQVVIDDPNASSKEKSEARKLAEAATEKIKNDPARMGDAVSTAEAAEIQDEEDAKAEKADQEAEKAADKLQAKEKAQAKVAERKADAKREEEAALDKSSKKPAPKQPLKGQRRLTCVRFFRDGNVLQYFEEGSRERRMISEGVRNGQTLDVTVKQEHYLRQSGPDCWEPDAQSV